MVMVVPDFKPGTRVRLPAFGDYPAEKMTYLGAGIFLVDAEDRDRENDDGIREVPWDYWGPQAEILEGAGIPGEDDVTEAEEYLTGFKNATGSTVMLPSELRLS